MKVTNHPKGNFPRWRFLERYCKGEAIIEVIIQEQSTRGQLSVGGGGNQPRGQLSGGQFCSGAR